MASETKIIKKRDILAAHMYMENIDVTATNQWHGGLFHLQEWKLQWKLDYYADTWCVMDTLYKAGPSHHNVPIYECISSS